MLERFIKGVDLSPALASKLAEDYERLSRGLPPRLEEYVLERYRLDLASEYGRLRVKNPFGKGSGQLSLNLKQVRADADAGLGFVVLKTIIAEDERGNQSMSEWAIPETRMKVEPVRGSDGSDGWTVTWKGRGWSDTFDAYLRLFADSLATGNEAGMLVVPSCKYHLPRPEEGEWRLGEYEHTTRRLLDVWETRRAGGGVMPVEKDFSPTLAGDDRAAQSETVERWMSAVTRLIREAARPRPVTVGLKLFNAMFDEDFQVEMLRLVNERCGDDGRPDFVVYANRLFDPERAFEGKRGVAYGGTDLSARNLRVLARLRALEQTGEAPRCAFPFSATGDINSGRMAAEYLLRGASTFQMHTFFQLPNDQYRMSGGGRTERALHELYFNPERGFLACLLRLRRALGWPEGWDVKRMADFCADPANGLWAEVKPAAVRA
jgi:dihydroorotate dehydrogenase